MPDPYMAEIGSQPILYFNVVIDFLAGNMAAQLKTTFSDSLATNYGLVTKLCPGRKGRSDV
jgi:hypothetical protein